MSCLYCFGLPSIYSQAKDHVAKLNHDGKAKILWGAFPLTGGQKVGGGLTKIFLKMMAIYL
jgi:hypothetical protein